MNRQKIVEELKKFIAIESVSTDPKRKDQIVKAAEYIKTKLVSLGFEVRLLTKDPFPPLVVAHKKVSDTAKTIGIYAHYDVQPEDPADEWKTPAFTLTSKEGKFYARGIADDKGHLWQNIVAIEELVQENKLESNIICVFEGEEETGSLNFEPYVKEASDLLSKADVFYITDVGMHERNIPQIEYGLRGILYFTLSVKIGERDLHSGIYGNRVYNPINVLADLVASIKDVNTGKIKLPGFYDKVRKIPKEELEVLKKGAVSDEQERKEAQTYTVTTVDGLPVYLSSKIAPSFDCHGILSGYTGEGSKTVIPKSAMVKFSFRLVEHQDPESIEKMVREYIQKKLPQGVKYELTTHGNAAPFYTDIENEYVKKTVEILEKEFGNKVLFNRSGGSIPAAEILQRLFKKPVVLTGFILPDCNLHSPNENYDEEIFWKGIEVLKRVYGI
ncbi:MAG: M20/M25/M40 family metallo-hydrolase [bacterium]|nr:M20/M25/M40 family metallo-hydrolase [bacterium]